MMKPSLTFTILLAVGTLCVASMSSASDALTLHNPGFENQLNDWDNQEDGGMSKVTSEAAHGGKFGLRVTDDSDLAGSGLYSQKIPVSGGKTYQVQCWYRTLSGSGIGLYLRFLRADGKMIAPTTEEDKAADRTPVAEADKNQGSWAQLSGKKTAPAEATMMVIYIHSYSKHKVMADFDDFAVTEVAK